MHLPLKKVPIYTPKWLAACASLFASLMLIQSMTNNFYTLTPQPLQRFVISIVIGFFKRSVPLFIQRLLLSPYHEFSRRFFHDPIMTLLVEEYHGFCDNEIYHAVEHYLQSKISPNTRLLKIGQTWRDTSSSYQFVDKQEFEDVYEGIELKWKFSSISNQQSFQLMFDVRHKEAVGCSYIPYVLKRFKAMKEETKIVRLCTLARKNGHNIKWQSITFGYYSATFATLALDPKLKTSILEDLDRFVKGKEFYQGVGRAWKRGYLLYGPPGTGKSSLIAAIANHLKFNIYDLQLSHLKSDVELRSVLVATSNQSILVIEDIDCGLELQDRTLVKTTSSSKDKDRADEPAITLSGLLNFIDGLWSGSAEQRIIIFTTNHKDKLDPALLRPGRMDMHIHMSYCTFGGFETLARNYLAIKEHQPLFDEIESLLQTAEVTPAQVAQELMKGDDAETALQGLITMLKEKIEHQKVGDQIKMREDEDSD
ncbi:AAA-ATPase [Rosa sericea]